MKGEAAYHLYRNLRETTEHRRRGLDAPDDVLYVLLHCMCDEMLAYDIDINMVVEMLRRQHSMSQETLRQGGYEHHHVDPVSDEVMN